ncbi:MAG: hypothetical protein ACFNZS_04170 [Ottowia sp.]
MFLKSMARIFMIILDSVCRFWPGKYQKAARKHPDAATMQRYFSKARQISGQDWMHRLIMVPCSASGSMTLEDGRKARWEMKPSRAALIRIDGGDYQEYFFFCSKADCGFPPFW